jgi:hypothetical protein
MGRVISSTWMSMPLDGSAPRHGRDATLILVIPAKAHGCPE